MSNAITTTTPTLPNSFNKEFSSKSLELLGTLGEATVTASEVMLPLAKSLIADGIVYTDLFSPDGGSVETQKQSTCTAEWFHGYLKSVCTKALPARTQAQIAWTDDFIKEQADPEFAKATRSKATKQINTVIARCRDKMYGISDGISNGKKNNARKLDRRVLEEVGKLVKALKVHGSLEQAPTLCFDHEQAWDFGVCTMQQVLTKVSTLAEGKKLSKRQNK